MYNNTNLPYKSLVHRYKSYPFLKFSNMNRCRIFISLLNSRIIISQLLLGLEKSFAALKWPLHRSPNQNMTKNALKIHKLKGSLKFRLRAAVEFFSRPDSSSFSPFLRRERWVLSRSQCPPDRRSRRLEIKIIGKKKKGFCKGQKINRRARNKNGKILKGQNIKKRIRNKNDKILERLKHKSKHKEMKMTRS